MDMKFILLEAPLSTIFSKGKVSFTDKRPLPSHFDIVTDNNAKWDVPHGLLHVEVDSAKLHGAYQDMPKYQTYNTSFTGKLKRDHDETYVCTFHWPDWDEIIDDYKDEIKNFFLRRKSTNLDDFIEDLFHKEDIQVQCTCPAFHWMGIKAKLQSKGLAIDQNTYPTTQNPNKIKKAEYLDAEMPLCKHLYAVSSELLTNKKMPVIKHILVYELQKEQW